MTHEFPRIIPQFAALCSLIFLTVLDYSLADPSYIQVPMNQSHYFGFDGPWQAVTALVGGVDGDDPSLFDGSYIYVDPSLQATVSLYPGFQWASYILTEELCESFEGDLYDCGTGGLWTPPNETNIDYEPYGDSIDLYLTGQEYRNALIIVGQQNAVSVKNMSLVGVSSGNITNPSGTHRPPDLGTFSLGADDEYQAFSLGTEDGASINAWTYPGYLYNTSVIPSYSFAIHVGSAALKYAGSLMFGGFDKSRLLGSVTTFNGQTTLLDVGLGVSQGASPFDSNSIDGLLVQGTGSNGSVPVVFEPANPYIYLPTDTCAAIAQHLPVSYDPITRYYVWNTTNENYTKIVQSPAYLSFTFPAPPGSTEPLLIRVPFILLNLTLTPPLVSQTTQYFPCMPYDPEDNVMTFGRAFLQAAYYGRNYPATLSWIGQAPGPGEGGSGNSPVLTNLVGVDVPTTGFSTDLFNSTWQSYWTVIAEPNVTIRNDPQTNGTTPKHEAHSGLGAGAKAGVGIGAASGAILLLSIPIFLFRSRSRKNKTPSETPLHTAEATNGDGSSSYNKPQNRESTLSGLSIADKNNVNTGPRELPGAEHQDVYELETRTWQDRD